MTNFYEAWLEHDYNPFILFDSTGKVIMLNQEAQYLLANVSIKEVFSLANTYANITFGFKTTLIDLHFNSFEFYAITVGYKDDDSIGIKLYKNTIKRFSAFKEINESVNIYELLDLCISTASICTNAIFKKEFDPTFPEIKINMEGFIKLFRKIYETHISDDFVKTTLGIKTGEYIKFNDKKYQIFYISIKGGKRDSSKEFEIEKLSSDINGIVFFSQNQTSVSLPMVY